MYYYVLIIGFLLRYFSEERNSSFLAKVRGGLRKQNNETYNEPSIGFVLAHPDDESMFFIPTINVLNKLNKSKNYNNTKLYFLYLSNGDSEGKGNQREIELYNLCSIYKYDCKVINDPDLKDSNNKWNPRVGLQYLKDFVNKNNITVLFTFDNKGVSGHPNHISTYESVRLLAKHYIHLRVFYLQSVNLFTKYSTFFSVFQLFPKKNCAISFSPFNVLNNMKVHKSQFKSHIPFWSFLSSYSYINSYDPV